MARRQIVVETYLEISLQNKILLGISKLSTKDRSKHMKILATNLLITESYSNADRVTSSSGNVPLQR